MSYNDPQNFLTKLDTPSYGTLRNTFPVIQGNTVTLEMELPFVPDDAVLKVHNEATTAKVQDCNLLKLFVEERLGKIWLKYHVKAESTCAPGDFTYSFTCNTEDEYDVFTKQVRLKVIPLLPNKVIQLLRTVRTLLGDDSLPTRAQVWTDLELLEYLNIAMQEVNATPTLTCFSIEQAPGNFGFIVALGAEYHALRALYNTEVRDVFNFNDDGLSVDISVRSEKYMNMINHISGSYVKAKEELKRHYRPRATGFSSAFTDMSIRNLRPFLVSSLSGYNY